MRLRALALCKSGYEWYISIKCNHKRKCIGITCLSVALECGTVHWSWFITINLECRYYTCYCSWLAQHLHVCVKVERKIKFSAYEDVFPWNISCILEATSYCYVFSGEGWFWRFVVWSEIKTQCQRCTEIQVWGWDGMNNITEPDIFKVQHCK